MLGLTWIGGLVRRRTARLLGQAAGIALAVLLLASLGTFFTASRTTMTAQAVGAVPVDWQVKVTPGTDAGAGAEDRDRVLRCRRGVARGLRRCVGILLNDQRHRANHRRRQGAGPAARLRRHLPGEIRPLVGAEAGVLVAQQTAANLGATVGSRVTILRPGQPKTTLTVDGVVDLPAADSLFQSIGAAPGSAPTAPPDNVFLLPDSTWERLFGNAPGSTTSTQIHVRLSHVLPADPGAAFAQVVGRAKNLEAALAGGGLVGNNLAARLDGSRADAIYAQMLFLFLGLPGVIIAALLAGVIAASGANRRRREQALLRVRGASPRQITTLAGDEALLTGVVGTALGLGAAAVVGRISFHTSQFGATTAQAVTWGVTAALFGLAVSALTVVVPAWRDARALSVRAEQATGASVAAGGVHKPVWARLYLDVICLGLGGLIYWQAVKNGYQVVLAPEGVPTISVSYFTLLAPLLFWVGPPS